MSFDPNARDAYRASRTGDEDRLEVSLDRSYGAWSVALLWTLTAMAPLGWVVSELLRREPYDPLRPLVIAGAMAVGAAYLAARAGQPRTHRGGSGADPGLPGAAAASRDAGDPDPARRALHGARGAAELDRPGARARRGSGPAPLVRGGQARRRQHGRSALAAGAQRSARALPRSRGLRTPRPRPGGGGPRSGSAGGGSVGSAPALLTSCYPTRPRSRRPPMSISRGVNSPRRSALSTKRGRA
jgi:hypothetical protein